MLVVKFSIFILKKGIFQPMKWPPPQFLESKEHNMQKAMQK